jgi:hypothetical protein
MKLANFFLWGFLYFCDFSTQRDVLVVQDKNTFFMKHGTSAIYWAPTSRGQSITILKSGKT